MPLNAPAGTTIKITDDDGEAAVRRVSPAELRDLIAGLADRGMLGTLKLAVAEAAIVEWSFDRPISREAIGQLHPDRMDEILSIALGIELEPWHKDGDPIGGIGRQWDAIRRLARKKLNRSPRQPQPSLPTDLLAFWRALIADETFRDLNGATTASILIAAIEWGNAHGLFWVKQETWAALVGIEKRTLQTHIQQARDAGVLAVEPHARPDGQQGANTYRIRLAARPREGDDLDVASRHDDIGAPSRHDDVSAPRTEVLNSDKNRHFDFRHEDTHERQGRAAARSPLTPCSTCGGDGMVEAPNDPDAMIKCPECVRSRRLSGRAPRARA
jgi:hypothetical protein